MVSNFELIRDNRWLKMREIDVWIDKKRVLNKINLDFFYGQNIAILGPNGSGKSTLLKLVNRSIYPRVQKDSELKIFENNLINIWNLRKKIGFLIDELDQRVESNTKVDELIISGFNGFFNNIRLSDIADHQRNRLNELLIQFDIKKISDHKYINLSQGQKKRVLIARALVHRPKILILDEPTNNLDLRSNWKLMQLLNRISKKDINILQVTHNIETITPSTNRVILMKNGFIIDDGEPKHIMTSSKLSSLYKIPMEVININGNWRVVPI